MLHDFSTHQVEVIKTIASQMEGIENLSLAIDAILKKTDIHKERKLALKNISLNGFPGGDV